MKIVLLSILIFISYVIAQDCLLNSNYVIKRNQTTVFEIDGSTVAIKNSALLVNGVDLMSKISSLESQILTLKSQLYPNWTQIAHFTGSTYIYPANYTGFNSPSSNLTVEWALNCSKFDYLSGNFRIRLIMGEVIDYFRPILSNTTLCQMLGSASLHQWSNNVVFGPWMTVVPIPYQYLGGSNANWSPIWPRSYATFWGGNYLPGGCCTNSYSLAYSGWYYGFDLFVVPGRN